MFNLICFLKEILVVPVLINYKEFFEYYEDFFKQKIDKELFQNNLNIDYLKNLKINQEGLSKVCLGINNFSIFLIYISKKLKKK